MQETVLITGGSGLVGSRLTQILLEKGYLVKHISRKCSSSENITCFNWDLNKGSWDNEAILNVDYIVHLAGANVAESRWSKKRKQHILESRVQSSQIVCKMVEASKGKIKGVVSSSAVGYYGLMAGTAVVNENAIPGDDFLANVCQQWESSISKCDSSVAIIRTGVVLSKHGGALQKMMAPIKRGVGAALGSGKQLMPWIHIDDLCELFIYALEHKWDGAYNGCSPDVISNFEFTNQLAKAINKPLFLPNVPSFILKIMLGEMAQMLLTGVNPSTDKVKRAGFEWKYSKLEYALKHILDPKY